MYTAVDEARLNSQAAACEALARKIMSKQDEETGAAYSVKGSWTGEAASLWAQKVKECDEAADEAVQMLFSIADELREYTASHHYIIEELAEKAKLEAEQAKNDTESQGAFGSGGSMGGR